MFRGMAELFFPEFLQGQAARLPHDLFEDAMSQPVPDRSQAGGIIKDQRREFTRGVIGKGLARMAGIFICRAAK